MYCDLNVMIFLECMVSERLLEDSGLPILCEASNFRILLALSRDYSARSPNSMQRHPANGVNKIIQLFQSPGNEFDPGLCGMDFAADTPV